MGLCRWGIVTLTPIIATDDAEAPGLGLNLEDFVSGAATADNDVYLFNADNANVSITSFGVTGQDTIYFGKEYTLKALGDDKITDNVGELDKLEIFWSVQGTTLTLYVEQETFAGNGSTTGDIVTVTLAGVAEDFTFEHGFLTAGEIA